MVLISILSRLGRVCRVTDALGSVVGGVCRLAGTLCAGCCACGAGGSLGGVGRVVGVLSSLGGVVGVLGAVPQGHGRHAGELLTDVVEQAAGLAQQAFEVLGGGDDVGDFLGQAGGPGGDVRGE